MLRLIGPAVALAAALPAQQISIALPTPNTVSAGAAGSSVGPTTWFPGPPPWTLAAGAGGHRAALTFVESAGGLGGRVDIALQVGPGQAASHHLDLLVQAQGLVWLHTSGNVPWRVDIGNDGTDEHGLVGRWFFFGPRTPIRVRSATTIAATSTPAAAAGSVQIAVDCDPCPLVHQVVGQGCSRLPLQAGGSFSSPWLQVSLPRPGILVIGWSTLPVPYPVGACNLLVAPDITAWISAPMVLAPGSRISFAMQAALFPTLEMTDAVGVEFR